MFDTSDIPNTFERSDEDWVQLVNVLQAKTRTNWEPTSLKSRASLADIAYLGLHPKPRQQNEVLQNRFYVKIKV